MEATELVGPAIRHEVSLYTKEGKASLPSPLSQGASASKAKAAVITHTPLEGGKAPTLKAWQPNLGAQSLHLASNLRVSRESKELEQPACGDKAKATGDVPHPDRLRLCLPWWAKWAPRHVVDLIKHGVSPPWEEGYAPFLSKSLREASQEQEKLALELITEYMAIGAVKELVPQQGMSITRFMDAADIRHLVPWFVLSKVEGDSFKHRLITDCRELNLHFKCPPFRMEHLGHIFPFLKRGLWAAKIDLKHAYFHLPVHPELQKYLVLKVGNRLFQFRCAPFGLNMLPFLWTQTMKPLAKSWRQQGILAFVYLDDILVLGKSVGRLEKQVHQVLQTLHHAGLGIN